MKLTERGEMQSNLYCLKFNNSKYDSCIYGVFSPG